MRSMLESQFLLTVPFIFLVPIVFSHMEALFMTSLSTVLLHQPLLWWNQILVLRILLKNKDLNRESYITGMLEFNVMEGYLMEGDNSI